MLDQRILDYIESHAKEARELLITLAQIPSPSNHEEKRAEFCREWLEMQGAKGVFIDDALNVIYPIAVTESCGRIHGPHGCGISGYRFSSP